MWSLRPTLRLSKHLQSIRNCSSIMAATKSEQMGVVFKTNGAPLEYKKIPVPKVGHDEVLINVKYSGVCDWPLSTKPNLVGGHEGAGIAVAIGENVHDVKIGDHVGIKWLNGSCGACEYCMNAFESCCPYALLSGYTVDGSFQQYAIGKAAHVARIPKSVNLAEAASILCAGITVYKALKESDARPGQWVALPGAGGGLGHLAVQYAIAMGLRVVGIDTGEEKKELVMGLGAEAFVDFKTSPNVIDEVKRITNGGPHAAIIIAASAKPYEDALKMVRTKGTVVAVGMPSHAIMGADVFDTVVRCLTIKGSYVGNRADTAEALDFLARGKVKVIYKMRGLSELAKVYEEMEKGEIAGRIVLDTSR